MLATLLDHYTSLPTYPFPKPTFCPKREVSVNVGSREGVGGPALLLKELRREIYPNSNSESCH